MGDKKGTIKGWLLLVICLFSLEMVQAQAEGRTQKKASNAFLEQAEAAKVNGDFALAEAYYRQALAKDPKNAKASYNLSHLYQDKQKNIESIDRLLQTAKQTDSKALKHKAFHNLGNAYMSMKDYRQAVNAYKEALRNRPSDDQTRYNLAIAKKKLEQKQQKKKGKKGSQQKKQNKNKQQQKKSDSNKNKQQKNKDKKGDQEKKKSKNKPGEGEKGKPKPKQPQKQKKQPQEKQKKQQKGKQQDGELSKQQAENLLRAARNLERKVQKKVRKRKPEKTPDNPNKKYW